MNFGVPESRMSMDADSREFDRDFSRVSPRARLRSILEANPDPGPSPEARLLEACDAELVRTALDRLRSLDREVLVLREMEARSYRDIGGILGVPIGTVMSRLSRARAQLVRELVGDPRSKV
jgi:RNA polymerase sigma factor (sigma-70 family)